MVEFKQILCPTDLSEASRPALSYAAAFAGWYGARLSILHVVPTFDAITVPPSELAGQVQVIYPTSREEVTAELRRQAEASGAANVQLDLDAAEGDPVAVIVERALDSRADLVVVGSHGRSGFIDRDIVQAGVVQRQGQRHSPDPTTGDSDTHIVAPPHRL